MKDELMIYDKPHFSILWHLTDQNQLFWHHTNNVALFPEKGTEVYFSVQKSPTEKGIDA